MKLSYFDLISPAPIYIDGVGGIVSPKLLSIASIGKLAYEQYINILALDVETLFTSSGKTDIYDSLSDEQKQSLHIFDFFVQDLNFIAQLEKMFNFFIVEDVIFSRKEGSFIVTKDKATLAESQQSTGVINRDNYMIVVDVICQRNNIKTKDINDPTKTKSKKALSIMQKLKKGRENMAKATKADKNMELGNIISAVANKSQSLNMVNIWDLTVFQLWDSFARLNSNNVYEINARSVSTWGDKDKHFDFNGWFKNLND